MIAIILLLVGGQLHLEQIPFDDMRACKAGTAAVEQLVKTKVAAVAPGVVIYITCVARGSTQGQHTGHQHTQGQQQMQDQQQAQ